MSVKQELSAHKEISILTKAGTTFCLAMAMLLGSTPIAVAQQQSPAKELARNVADSTKHSVEVEEKHPTGVEENTANTKRNESTTSLSVEDRLKAMEQLIERQQLEIKSLRDIVEKKGDATAGARAADAPQTQGNQPLDGQPQLATAANQAKTPAKDQPSPSDSQKRVDELYKKFVAIRFSGDLRFRGETFRTQGFDAVTEPADRNRLRIRARLALDGTIDKHFDWGMRLATGIFTDPITTNQTFTDAFERKAFALDRAFVRYDSKTDAVGVQLV